MGAIRSVIVRLIDRWLSFRAWYDQRRDRIANLELQIERERERHEREESRLKDDLAIAHKHIQLLTDDNQKFHAMINRDRAIIARDEGMAQLHDPRIRQ